ncbi:hypothetical protein HZB04_01440 [Candidatus Wolfebacteria bacterium]|nr:hypothetical protein [Candidatus Wolfebacteria bacterium]
MNWNPKEFACPHCGTPNPDGGSRCGNCGENPYILPSPDAQLTIEQLVCLKATRRQIRVVSRSD